MATKSAKIVIRNSFTTSAVPNTSVITAAELAINLADRKMYSSDGSAVFQVAPGMTEFNLKAPTANPTFTGVAAAVTPAVNTNTTQLATTAFVLAQAANTNPVVNGTAAVGVSTLFARQDHVHPSDTTKANLASPALTGAPTSTTAAVDTNTTQIATTAFVLAQAANVAPIVDGTAAVGSSTRYARQDHVHPIDTTRAPLASPTFTGVPAAATAAVNTNTTQIATTAFVVAQAANTAPLINGVAAIGTSLMFARQDHVHASDTTKANLASPVFTGVPAVPTAAVNTNNTQAASTAFVLAQAANVAPVMDGTATIGTATLFARQDHVHPSDTTRAPLASPVFTGTPSAPTPTAGASNTQIATTAFVAPAILLANSAVQSNTMSVYDPAAKAPVRVVSTANIALTGLLTVDGVTVTAADRVLVTGQSNTVLNGIYAAASGAWTRASDFNTGAALNKGLQVLVTDGTTLAGSNWVLSANTPTIGTSNVSFTNSALYFNNIQLDSATGNGSTTSYALTRDPGLPANIQVSVSGIVQQYSASAWSLTYPSGVPTVVFSEAPPSGSTIEFKYGNYQLLQALNSYTVSNGTGDGTTTDFTLTSDPGSPFNVSVSLSGVMQMVTDYSLIYVSGVPKIRFVTAPAAGLPIEFRAGGSVTIGAPALGTVATYASGLLANTALQSQTLVNFGGSAASSNNNLAVSNAASSAYPIYVSEGLFQTSLTTSQLPLRMYGPGQVQDTTGSRARNFSWLKQAPASISSSPGSVDSGYTGDLTTVQNVHEFRVTGTALGTPNTGYLQVAETAMEILNVFVSSGYNQANTAGGRTGFAAKDNRLGHYGQGDAFLHFWSATSAGAAHTGATDFLANPAVGLFNGSLGAQANGTYLNTFELNHYDNGYRAAVAPVFNMFRTVDANTLQEVWMGLRINSQGPASIDAGLSINGYLKRGIDLSPGIFDTNKAAITIAGNTRQYFNAVASGVVAWSQSPGLEWLEYNTSVSRFKFVNNGVTALTVAAPPSAVNNLHIAGNVTNGAPTISATGTDTNISIYAIPKGTGTMIINISNVPNYANDTAAAAGGIGVGSVYRNGSVLMIRVT